MASAFTSALVKQQGASGLGASTIMIPIILKAFGPLPPLVSLVLPANATLYVLLATLIQHLRLPRKVAQMLRLTRIGGQSVGSNTTLATLAGPPVRNAAGQTVIPPLTLEVRMGIKGGKGGFGSMLRAQGGKMSSNRNGEENNDSCRDLNGRRLSTVKQARQLALYLSTQAERERELSEAQKKKYAKLEKMLGRKPRGEKEFVEAAQKLHDQGGSLEEGDSGCDNNEDDDNRGEGSSRAAAAPTTEYKGKKRDRIDDSEYLEQSREIVDNVRSAVALAMKKKKKQKVASAAGVKPATPSAQKV